jgi:two-component system sensor histidine kinase BaeS
MVYRSLYWRIAVGFIVCIATVLAVQGALLLWLVSREDPDSRTSFTLRVSNDLSQALVGNPALDIGAFVTRRYPDPPRSFYIIMTSGQTYFFGDRRPPPSTVQGVQDWFQNASLMTIPSRWEHAPYWASSIIVDGVLRGTVSIVPRDFVAELWQPMALLGFCLLAIGTALASWFIFGPAHRRLKALETTAQLLGAGDVGARAEEHGGDEVASLARTFNVMARDLAARAGQIDEFDRTRRLLLADISHELMTPLTAIRGYQEKLSTDPEISRSTVRRRYVAIIGEEALRVERIVGDLLDLARLESRGDVLNIQDVSVEGLFGRVGARHEAEATDRRVRLSTTIERSAEIVRGDQFRLEQALQNLVANALRHVPEGGAVELNAVLSGREVVITVRDTGTGIAAEHLPFIFDRFYKVDASRVAGAEGSGLGLSIVKAIIEQHGGSIVVTSQPAGGTMFTLRLPASADT